MTVLEGGVHINVHIVCLSNRWCATVGNRNESHHVSRICSATDCAEVRRENVGCPASARPGLDWLQPVIAGLEVTTVGIRIARAR